MKLFAISNGKKSFRTFYNGYHSFHLSGSFILQGDRGKNAPRHIQHYRKQGEESETANSNLSLLYAMYLSHATLLVFIFAL